MGDGSDSKASACKPEELSVNPRTHEKQPDTVACTCNPRARETKSGGSLGLTDQPAWPNWRAPGQWETLLSQKLNVNGTWGTTSEVFLWPPPGYTYTHVHPYTWTGTHICKKNPSYAPWPVFNYSLHWSSFPSHLKIFQNIFRSSKMIHEHSA